MISDKILFIYREKEFLHELLRRIGVNPNNIEGTRNDKYDSMEFLQYPDSKSEWGEYNHILYKYIKFSDELWFGDNVNLLLSYYQADEKYMLG